MPLMLADSALLPQVALDAKATLLFHMMEQRINILDDVDSEQGRDAIFRAVQLATLPALDRLFPAELTPEAMAEPLHALAESDALDSRRFFNLVNGSDEASAGERVLFTHAGTFCAGLY